MCSLLEVVHAAMGLVRTGLVGAFTQWFARTHCLLAVVDSVVEVRFHKRLHKRSARHIHPISCPHTTARSVQPSDAVGCVAALPGVCSRSFTRTFRRLPG